MARKALSVDDWFLEIEHGLEYRRQYGLEDYWAEHEALFYSVHPSQDNSGPNIIASTGDALLSTLTVPYPSFSLKPRVPEFIRRSRIQESVDNMLVSDLDMRVSAEASTLHCFLYGKGLFKLGYDSEFGWDRELDVGQILNDGNPLGMSMTQFDRNSNRIEYNGAKPGMPWLLPILPHDFIVPWGTIQLEFAPWAIHRVIRHIDDIKEDPKYENKRGLEPHMSMEDYMQSYLTTLKPYRLGETIVAPTVMEDGRGKAEYVELWEIHDRRTQRIFVLASGYPKFLRNVPDACQEYGLPFVEMTLTPKARSFWTTPDAYYLRQAQAELTDISIQSTKQRRISVIKFLYNRNLITPEEFERAISAEVGAGIAVEDLKNGQKLTDAIATFQPPANMLYYQESENVRRNARETVGFSRNQLGEFEATGRRTAFEAKVVDDSSRLRMSRRHLALQDLYTKTIKKINALIHKYWTTPRITEVIGPDGKAAWETFTGPDLRSEYHYSVGLVSNPPEDQNSRKQVAIQLYATLAQDPTVDPILLRRYLARAFNDPEFSSIFKPGVLEGSQEAMQQATMQNPEMMGMAEGNLDQNAGGQQQAGGMSNVAQG
jgi:hypothetical protein